MNRYANAALSLNRRRLLCPRRVVDERWTVTKVTEAAEVSVRFARKWVGCCRVEGDVGLLDRSSPAGSIPHRILKGSLRSGSQYRRSSLPERQP
jgi:hypothetical protein